MPPLGAAYSGGWMGGVRLVRATDSLRTPWRNGAGWTLTLAQGPLEADLDTFAWRVSCAEIAADAPFSTFPGVQRELMLVDGGPLELVVDGASHVLEAEQTLTFSGDAQVSCRVTRALPAVALNVMTRPGLATATLTVESVRPGLVLTAPDRGALVALALGPHPRVGAEAAPMGRFEAVWCGPGEDAAIGGSGRLAVVRVHPEAMGRG